MENNSKELSNEELEKIIDMYGRKNNDLLLSINSRKYVTKIETLKELGISATAGICGLIVDEKTSLIALTVGLTLTAIDLGISCSRTTNEEIEYVDNNIAMHKYQGVLEKRLKWEKYI